jgi:hypothetical protein
MLLTLRQWQNTKKDLEDLIVQASVKDGSDSWTNFPIGYMYTYNKESDKNSVHFGKHDKLVLCAVNTTTDEIRRPDGINRSGIINRLRENSIENIQLKSKTYFSSIPSYKFIISPEGNGIDCHRHYEALLAGCIPIIEFNMRIEDKYKGLPILYTKDYSEITSEYLESVYNNMIDTTYDFSRLFKSYYTIKEQNAMDDHHNYWVTKMNYINTPDYYFQGLFGHPLVWITIINKAYINFTKNFLKSMEVNNCPFKLVVYCIDTEIIDELSEYPNAICFDASCFLKEKMTSNFTEWFSVDYRKICFSKLDAIKYTVDICNRYGIWAVGYIDTDIIVFKDPTKTIRNSMANNQNIAIFSQCDEDSITCSNMHICNSFCAGIIVFRTGSIDTTIFDYSNDDIIKYNSDQDYLLDIVIKKQIRRITIPKNVFLNGAYPGVKGQGDLILPESAALLHYNYMHGSEKEACMKLHSMWYI